MNAKQELENFCTIYNIKCADIDFGYRWGDEDKPRKYELPVNHTVADAIAFFKSLDFTYDNGYGQQMLHGIVWLENGTWLERGEYDGSEWWEERILPDIPKHLQ